MMKRFVFLMALAVLFISGVSVFADQTWTAIQSRSGISPDQTEVKKFVGQSGNQLVQPLSNPDMMTTTREWPMGFHGAEW
jgi:hypothetical protein